MSHKQWFLAGGGFGLVLLALLWPFLGLIQVLLAITVVLGFVALWAVALAKVLHAYRGPWRIDAQEGHYPALRYRDGHIEKLEEVYPFPNVTTYSPRTVSPALSPPTSVIDAAPALPPLPSAPPFAAIAHQISPGHLVLGYGSAGRIGGDISDLLSTAIAGRPGTGKTTLLRFVCAQVLRIGGQPVLFDPHGSIADELSGLLECAEDASDMERLAEQLESQLEARLSARRAGQPPAVPLLLLADEWPIISQLAPEAVRVAGRIVLEGRKVGVYALISGQGLPSEQLGGSLVRDALSSRYVFQTTPAQARMAGLDNETAKRLLLTLEAAGPGYAILASARRKPEVVAIPDTSPDDLRAFLAPGTVLPPLPPDFLSRLEAAQAQKQPNPSLAFSRAQESARESLKTPLVSAREKAKQDILGWFAQGVTKPHVIARKMGRASSYAEDVRQILQEEELI